MVERTFERNYTYLTCLIVILSTDILFIVLLIAGQAKKYPVLFITACIMSGLATAVVVRSALSRLKMFHIHKLRTTILKRADELYFYEFKLRRYLEMDALRRFQIYLGYGMCRELSILAMILAKDYKSARLCQGEYHTKNHSTKHAWVEVKIPFAGWIVLDLSLINEVITKQSYRELFEQLTCEWTCSYEEFWEITFLEPFLKAMGKPETSYILPEMTVFNTEMDENGIGKYAYTLNTLYFDYSQEKKAPAYRSIRGKPISTQIIQDFLDNPKCDKPKKESILAAEEEIRQNEESA